MRKLRYTVHLRHGGAAHVFRPEDNVPDWAAAMITNPKAWEVNDSVPQEPVVDAPTPEVPARQGKGSSRKLWSDFAQANGVAVSDEDSRNDIITACESAGLIEPE